jgi:hypothetical protein
MITVGTNGSFSASRKNFVYNVVPSLNVILISSVGINAVITLNNCSFSVNGSSAVVPRTIINHVGGSITISLTTFQNIALNGRALITYYGIYIC